MEGQLGEKSSRAHCENMENTPLHCIVRKCNVDSTAGITVNPLCRNGYRHWYSQASRAARKKCLTRHRAPCYHTHTGTLPSPTKLNKATRPERMEHHEKTE